MLVDNIVEVQENINKACERVGRNPKEVTLIAVSKTKPVSMLEEVFEAGIMEFGENKVQEMNEKHDLLSNQIHWHMIGHLQRNKVKYIVNYVNLIHSVDSLRLAEAISMESAKINVTTDILLEVNVACEDTKYGFKCEETEQIVHSISQLPNINIKGLMTSAPFVENAEENRKYFRQLKQLCVDINKKNIDNVYMDVLSMGMTNDYITAVEEGSTMVRVGTAIFGGRNYNK